MIRKLLGLDWLARKLGYVEQDVRVMRRDLTDLVGRVQELEERAAGVVRLPQLTRVEPMPVPVKPHCVAPALVSCSCAGECTLARPVLASVRLDVPCVRRQVRRSARRCEASAMIGHCNATKPDRIRACREACAPETVREYNDGEGCTCN